MMEENEAKEIVTSCRKTEDMDMDGKEMILELWLSQQLKMRLT